MAQETSVYITDSGEIFKCEECNHTEMREESFSFSHDCGRCWGTMYVLKLYCANCNNETYTESYLDDPSEDYDDDYDNYYDDYWDDEE